MTYKERDFVTWIEIPVRVYFDYQPEEKATHTYPGCPSSIEINQIDIDTPDGQSVSDWLMEKYGEDLVRECWEHLD